MSRTEKLYQRLNELESQYSGLLRKELEAVLRGEVGHYIGSQLREDWSRWVCRAPDDRAIELEGLEKEIGKLRSKLGEPVPGDAVNVAKALVQRIKDAGECSPGANKAWLREAIAKIVQLGQPET